MRVVRVLLAFVLALVGLPTTAAGASVAAGERAPAEVPLHIIDTSTFVADDGTFSFEVDNSGLRLTDELAWTVHSLVPNDPAAIETALNDEPGPPLRTEQRSSIGGLGLEGGQPADTTVGDERRATTVRIPVRSESSDSDRVYLPDAGIYPVSVRLLRDGNELDTVTLPLIRLEQTPGDHPRLVHLVRTVVGGPSLLVDGDSKASAEDAITLRELAEQLAGLPADADQSAVSVSLPAELIDSFATAGDDDEAAIVEELAKVADRANWLASPYVPLNLGAWAAADVAQNPALSLSYDTAERRLSALLDVDVNDALAPPDWTLAAPAIGFLAERGAAAVLLDPNVAPPGNRAGAPSSVRGTAVRNADRRTRETERPEDTTAATVQESLPALSVIDFDAAAGTDGTGNDADADAARVDAAAVARQLALLSAAPLADNEGPNPPGDTDEDQTAGPFDVVALRVPDSLEEGQLGAMVASLSSAKGVLAPTGADGLLRTIGTTSRADRPRSGQQLVLRNATTAQLGPLELSTYRGQQAVNAATVLDPGNEAVELAQRQLLVAPHLGLPPDEAEAYALAARGAAQAVLDSVSLGDLSTITLAARRSKVPFRFRNELADPVTVSLRVQSDRLRFTDAGADGRIELRLPPGNSTSEVSVEVITSGVFSVTADVLTPTGSDVIERQEFQVRSRAFSGVGVALSVTSLIVLALWWIRTARAKHRGDAA